MTKVIPTRQKIYVKSSDKHRNVFTIKICVCMFKTLYHDICISEIYNNSILLVSTTNILLGADEPFFLLRMGIMPQTGVFMETFSKQTSLRYKADSH